MLGKNLMKVLKCGLVGGIVLFIWGLFFWKGIVHPSGMYSRQAFANEAEVTNAIKNNAPKSGIYSLPNLAQHRGDKEALEAARQQRAQGPFVVASVQLEGKASGMMNAGLKLLILKIVLVSIVSWFIFQAGKMDYKRTVKSMTMGGVLVALAMIVPTMVFFGFPGNFAFLIFIDTVIGWFLAGIAVGKFCK